jgi:uncharacterized membrane protein YczE
VRHVPGPEPGRRLPSFRYDPPVRDRWFSRSVLRRLPKLLFGLVIFGLGIALMAQAGIGLGPWEVFHQGLSRLTGISLGTVSILLGLPILVAWLPLGEQPGIGTVLNIVVIGVATNLVMGVLPPQKDTLVQLVMMASGVVTIGIASGMYLATDLGAGPRDGLMTGIHHHYGWSISRARTSLEITVLVAGYLMGGTVGLGTVVFAFGIGPIVQWALGIFDPTGAVARRRRAALGPPSPDVVEGPAE